MAPVDTLSFKCALVTGGSGGLGKAMAAELVKRGKEVIIVGRDEEKLVAASKEIGALAHFVFDTGDISAIEPFIAKLIKEYPQLDAVINNAGVQRPLEVLGPDYGFDLGDADEEININVRGPMHLCVGLIKSHFASLPDGAVIMNVTSALGFVPMAVVNPVYCGTKAFLHSFSVNLRSQLKKVDSKIKVVEVVPPLVLSDLHRNRKDPSEVTKEKYPFALTPDEFMADVIKGWEANTDTVGAGPSKKIIDTWQGSIGAIYDHVTASQ